MYSGKVMYDEEKNIISLLFFIILKLGLIFYFIYHVAFNGFGVFNYKNFYEIYYNKKLELKKAEQEFSKKQNKINRLQVNNLDLDLFDEVVRKNLGVAGDDEIVLFIKDIKTE